MTVDLITLAHESETAEAFEAGALGLLAQTLGLDAAFFLVRGREDAVTLLGLDATTRARMAKHGATYAQELLPVKRAALAARGVAVDTEVCGIARVRKTRYYAEIARQVSGQHSLMAYLPWRGGVVAAMNARSQHEGLLSSRRVVDRIFAAHLGGNPCSVRLATGLWASSQAASGEFAEAARVRTRFSRPSFSTNPWRHARGA